MNVVMISPGFPDDLPLFTRGLARVGARVLGVGDQPKAALEETDVAEALTAYLHGGRPLERGEDRRGRAASWLAKHRVEADRVECLWEPGVMLLAARLRARLGIPGLSVEQAERFRDKETMKADPRRRRHPHAPPLRAARTARTRCARAPRGDRLPRSSSSRSTAPARPTRGRLRDGGGARTRARRDRTTSTEVSRRGVHRGRGVHLRHDLRRRRRALPERVVVPAEAAVHAACNPWISPRRHLSRATCRWTPRSPAASRPGPPTCSRRSASARASRHMEWFRTPDGEVVFGEIGARAPGGRLTHVMNLRVRRGPVHRLGRGRDCSGRISQDLTKRFNVGMVSSSAPRATANASRASRASTPSSVEHGEHVPLIELVPVGAPRRDHTREVIGATAGSVVAPPRPRDLRCASPTGSRTR